MGNSSFNKEQFVRAQQRPTKGLIYENPSLLPGESARAIFQGLDPGAAGKGILISPVPRIQRRGDAMALGKKANWTRPILNEDVGGICAEY